MSAAPPDSPAGPDGHDPLRDQLIESIYRIALDPQSYDAFMDRWGEYVSDRLLSRIEGDESGEEATNAPGLAPHFTLAASLLDQSMPPPVPIDAPGNGRPADTPDDNGVAPRFLIGHGGRIVWHNIAAERRLGLTRGSMLPDLPLEPAARSTLDLMVRSLGQNRRGRRNMPVVLALSVPGTGEIGHFHARIMPDGTDNEVILVAPVSARWPAAMPQLLGEDFGLTPSEIEICEAIARGRSATQIAALRMSALATVRTQIKRVMAKTRTTAQPELVHLLHLLMRIAEDHRGGLSHIPAKGAEIRQVALAGRTMPVELMGPETGDPVIFLHGMLDGTGMTDACIALLHRLNLRLICPVRPRFGTAEADSGPDETALERLADDIQGAIRALRLTRPVVMGHMAGAAYAFAVAAAAPPDQLAGIVNVAGGVPILSATQFSTMPPRQRLVAYTARYSPGFLPFVLRAGIRQMRSGGERKFLLSLYETAPHDLPVATRPEIQAVLLAGYRFSVTQGHRAFEIDSRHVVSDWTALADATALPVRLVHGAHDAVVSIASVRDFAARRPGRVVLDEVENAGQLVFYRDPGRVLRAARSLLDQPQD